jgi:hypothetical protein
LVYLHEIAAAAVSRQHGDAFLDRASPGELFSSLFAFRIHSDNSPKESTSNAFMPPDSCTVIVKAWT